MGNITSFAINLGFVGHQPNVANTYSNNGSTYITSLIFLPLGLPDNHLFNLIIEINFLYI